MSDTDESAVNEVVETSATDTDSAPVESPPEVAETPVQRDNGELILKPEPEATPDDEATDEAPDTTSSEETKPEEQPEATDDTPEPPQEELAPKSQNRFQQLANENREMKAELDRLRRQETQIAAEQQLINEVNPETGEFYTPQEIERIAFQQSKQQQAQDVATQRYELEVQEVQSQLRDEATRALSDFPMFDETSKEYDEELAAEVDELLGANLVLEEGTNRIIGSRVSPYKIYQSHVRAAEKARQQGQINGQKATERMLASVDGTGSNQKGEASFDKLSTAEMAARLRKAGRDV